MSVSIRLDGDTRGLLRRMGQFADVDKKGINAALGEALRSSTVMRFKTQTGPDGKKWVPSSRANQEGGVTLVDTARLRNSIKSSADRTGFAVGTNTIYAATHQNGDKNRRITIRAKTSKGLVFKVNGHWIRKQQVNVSVTIPARPFLGLSDDDADEIKQTLEDALREE